MGNKGSFKPGHVAWNKGIKGIHMSPKTEFKPGQTAMEKSNNWKGGVQRMSTGEVYIAVAPNKRVREARLVWEQHNGEIPKGFIIYHLDGDPSNNDIKNLEMISRSELVRRNKNARNANR